MEMVKDLAHFSSLVKLSKSFPGISISNCFLLPASIQQFSQQKRLFCEETESGVYFFYDEGNYFRLYFYCTDQTKIQFGKQNKPVVIDLVFRDIQPSNTLEEIEKKWVAIGFSRYKIYKRMTLEVKQYKLMHDSSPAIDNTQYSVTYACPEQCNELTALWKNTLDVYSNALPSVEEMIDTIVHRQILCVRDNTGRIAAALQFIQQNKVCTIQHVAVDDIHRRKGLANYLVNSCFAECKDINHFILWVEAHNTPAINLYFNIGFRFDGMVSNQLFRNQ